MNQQPPLQLDQALRTMQVIAGALVGGVLAFALIGVVIVGALSEPPSGMLISLIGALLGVSSVGMHIVVPGVVERQARREEHAGLSVEQLVGVFQARLIVGLAILEGAALFNVIATIIEHNWWSLGIAGLLVFWMLIAFPTRTRVEQWIETQQMLLS